MRKAIKNLINFIPVVLLITTMTATDSKADQVILDDLIVDGSTCVGADCVNGEEFGFDTVRIKDPDPSILFQDTSSTSAFPTNDWRIGASDGNIGSAATFFLEDVTGGTMALQIESGVNGGIALGTGSTLKSGTVSVGSAGNERRITNVADGIAGTDAVNMGQFSIYQTAFNASVASGGFTDGFQDQLDALQDMQSSLDRRLNSLQSELKEVAASAAAFSAVQANPKADGNTQISLGLGNYRDKSSIAAGLYRFAASDQVMLNVGVAASMSGGALSSRAGMTFGW